MHKRNFLEDLGVNGKIILKIDLKEAFKDVDLIY
jgi:hypothetical protein